MYKSLVFLAAALFSSIAMIGASHAAISEGVVASVDNMAITSYELEQRSLLALLGTGMPATDESVRRIKPVIIRSLADELLHQKEASRNGIIVSEPDLEKAVDNIIQKNGSTPEIFKAKLASNGISFETLRSQIRSQLLWNRIMAARIRPQISVSEDEIYNFVEVSEKATTQTEFQISEILLRVDTPESENQVANMASKIKADVASGAASFESLKREISARGAIDAEGEKWITSDLMDAEVAQAMQSAEIGMIAGPIRTSDGYHIVKLINKREQTFDPGDHITLDIRQIIYPLPKKEDAEGVDNIAESLREATEKTSGYATCDEFAEAALQINTPAEVNLGKIKYADIMEPIKSRIQRLKANDKTTPFRTKYGIHVLMVCGRDLNLSEETVSDIKQSIFNRKLELESRKYMRNLRRNSLVEIKI